LRGADDRPVSIFASRSGLKKFVLEEKITRGLAVDPSVIENYPSFPARAWKNPSISFNPSSILIENPNLRKFFYIRTLHKAMDSGYKCF